MRKKQNCWKRLFTPLLAAALVMALQMGAFALELVPVGQAVGLEMRLDGVMVAGLVSDDQGGSPAGDAGVITGDIIIAVDGQTVDSGAVLLEKLQAWKGGELCLRVRRGEAEQEVQVCPERGAEGEARLGLWLRDSIAGIGTVTYFDPASGVYGALGHGVTDADTGALMPLEEGVVLGASVREVRKGEAGAPGELCGDFDPQDVRGNILGNTSAGIFGRLRKTPEADSLTVATEAEIQTGAAQILCNVSGTEIRTYDVEITKICRGDAGGRNLQLKVTDPALLEQTGGIVQGMSGSPILQNGKLVGAVTHVLVNDPGRGYGISMEQMLAAAEAIVA